MATKLGRKEFPAGFTPDQFKYMGRPANDQSDFGADVGIADMACVNQFGDADNSKYYHAGVVQAGTSWFAYLEWGRIKPGKAWGTGSFNGQDFQFVQCDSESDARAFFASQCRDKNTKRIAQTDIGGKMVWAAKADKDGYIVQRLATRERGLPDAYTIKDGTGIAAKPVATVTATTPAPTKTFEPQVVSIAQALVGGTKDFARAASAATGIVPTLAAIEEVRNDCIPTALKLIAKIGVDEKAQLADRGLQDLSKYVATQVPRVIPRGGDPLAILLTSANILAIQQDLDAFESALSSEDFTPSTKTIATGYDPEKALNAHLRWLDPKSDEGKWLVTALQSMSNNRHGYLSGNIKVLNAFAVTRPDRDAQFLSSVKRVADKRQGRFGLRANLQPKRIDVDGLSDDYAQANVILTQHGTRSVNIAPILQTHFRLPQSLSGIPLAGANFGHGTYFATDFRKAVGYSSYSGSLYGGGGGAVPGRGAFMFLTDMIMGDAYRAPSTGSWTTPPDGKDSVFGVGGDRGHRLENDEHICFKPEHIRVRYLVEFGF